MDNCAPTKSITSLISVTAFFFLVQAIATPCAAQGIRNISGCDAASAAVTMLRIPWPDIGSAALDVAPKLEASPVTIPAGATFSAVRIMASGPALANGPYDVHRVDTACTPDGILLTITIMRSRIVGTDGKNLSTLGTPPPWRPQIECEILFTRPEVLIEAKWVIT